MSGEEVIVQRILIASTAVLAVAFVTLLASIVSAGLENEALETSATCCSDGNKLNQSL